LDGDRATKTALLEVKEGKMLRVPTALILLFLPGLVSQSATGQWLIYPAAGIPRLPNGNPNLSAPAPRSPDGKPDLYGIWVMDQTPQEGPFIQAPRNEIKPEDIILTPQGEALQRQIKENFSDAECLPLNFPGLARVQPFKILPSRGSVAILYEFSTTYRQIFMDGRELPKDPNPAWRGYSVGKWDGDTLVVDTNGFNDRTNLSGGRRPHSDALHIIERFRRPDFGHLEIQYTIDDPKVYAKPWTIKQHHHLTPDTELMEYFCNENEKDLRHMVGVDR
jgi:hypothetical protein